MTWRDLASQTAERLHDCKNIADFETTIEQLRIEVKAKWQEPPNGWKWFWNLVAEAYEKQPRLLLKEAAAAAALNALAQAALSIIQAQGSK